FHLLLQMALTVLVMKGVLTDAGAVLGIGLFVVLAIYNMISFNLLLTHPEKFFFKKHSILVIITLLHIALDVNVYMYTKYGIEINTLIHFYLILVYIGLLTEGLVSLKSLKICLVAFVTTLLVLRNIDILLFLRLLHGGYLVIGFVPIYLIVRNWKKLKRDGTYSYAVLVTYAIIFLIFVSSAFWIHIPVRETNNLDGYCMMLLSETILLGFIFKGQKQKLEIQSKVISSAMVLPVLLWFLVIYLLTKDIYAALVIALSINMLLFMLKHYRTYQSLRKEEVEFLFEDAIKMAALESGFEKLYAERTTKFLHDEILQDIIVVNRGLKDQGETHNEFNQILTNTIGKIRQEINLYSPRLSQSKSLNESYYQLIQEIQSRYKSRGILFDFQCDEKLYLPHPYEEVIYTCLYEMVTNACKHSKGTYTLIQLEKRGGNVELKVTNEGDFMDEEELEMKKSTGLQLLQMDVQRYGGNLQMKSGENRESRESLVEFTIQIPIRRGKTYENFTNRRS
ncbi:MAG: hypothetical protein Q4Q17_04680, partial [Tissierellia bacterium]|nr:hypothetical protein [Tissierellia bacterium]